MRLLTYNIHKGIGGTDRARSRHSWPRVAKETAAIYEKARL